jgi:hypothetical protein
VKKRCFRCWCGKPRKPFNRYCKQHGGGSLTVQLPRWHGNRYFNWLLQRSGVTGDYS